MCLCGYYFGSYWALNMLTLVGYNTMSRSIVASSFLLALVANACGGTSDKPNTATGIDTSSTTGTGGSSTGLVGDTSVGGTASAGGTDNAGGLSNAGGDATTTSNSGPVFAQYDPSGSSLRQSDITFSNGQIASMTDYYYVQNTGGSGTATVTITYQGQTDTKQFNVDGGVQYVLSSLSSLSNTSVYTCTLSIELPGLTINKKMTTTATCAQIRGPTTSDLIPLSSCGCSGGCPTGVCFNNCGFPDQTCCGGCTVAGTSCNAGSCQ